MLKNYFKTSLRSLWRNRLFTTLNIFGLAIGISVCWMVFSIIRYEFSYDKNLSGKESIYRIVSSFILDDKESYNGGVSAPLYQGIQAQIAGMQHVVPFFEQWLSAAVIPKRDGSLLTIEEPEAIAATDSSYFNMLPYQWLAGNKSTALTSPESVVLTESRMQQYFPGKQPGEAMYQTITYYGFRDTLQKTVTGIVKDFSEPTEFTAKEFFALENKAYDLVAWTNTNGTDKLYLQFAENPTPDRVTAQIQSLADNKWKEFAQQRSISFSSTRRFELIPLPDVHFATHVHERNGRKASKPVMYGLAGIGLFLLILACINYINMSIAQIPQRAKEIGVRKTLGGSRGILIGQFMMETSLTILLAVSLASSIGQLGFWFLQDIIPPGIEPLDNLPELLFFASILAVTIILLAGLYPAWLITRVKTVNMFRNVAAKQSIGKKINLQKALIVFQFAIALVFITATLIGGQQLHYTLKSDMGFNKDAVALVDIPWKYRTNKLYEDKQFALFNELKSIPGIRDISLGSVPLQNGYTSSPFVYMKDGKEPVSRQLYKKWVDTAYVSLYDMRLLAGRNLLPSDATNEVVLNEAAVKAYGFASPQDAIGKILKQGDKLIPIVGVIKDFHMQNFYNQIEPAALMCDKKNLGAFNIKLYREHPEQWPTVMRSIEKKWNRFYPSGSFRYNFYDDAIRQLYTPEWNLAKLINLATAIAIFISCLGLFGMATFTAFRRTKEIGIRKVLGASVPQLASLLSKEFVKIVLIANVMAWPIAWYAMNRWLQNFAYRIDISWWIFALAGGVALAIALLTVSTQAIKVALTNPVEALRYE
ncbi:MAG: hypothetical protein ALAOOOJD_00214 [bacterium]|nr:hypothetical protein [bacterium]